MTLFINPTSSLKEKAYPYCSGLNRMQTLSGLKSSYARTSKKAGSDTCDRGNRTTNLLWIHAYNQNKVAELETDTPGYDLLNAELALTGSGRDQFERQLYLKGQAPQTGLNIIFGVLIFF